MKRHALGSFGLLLIGLTIWAVERLQRGALMDRVLARLVLAWVAAIGWIFDRVPLPEPQRPATKVPRARPAYRLRTR